ncbi:MAG: DUF2442 domain-containing protein [Gemmatimonadales bacterium]|nr:DUF2442 domain-containing protein [Gemmatimonadales bacterium]
MTSSLPEARNGRASDVRTTAEALIVDLVDGRTITVPLGWYPRLAHASEAERADCRVIADGAGIHWPALDEDISVEALLSGRGSAESPASLDRWLRARVG